MQKKFFSKAVIWQILLIIVFSCMAMASSSSQQVTEHVDAFVDGWVEGRQYR